MYNQGFDLYQNFACADLNNTINANGQNSESGRDQAHTQLSLHNMAELSKRPTTRVITIGISSIHGSLLGMSTLLRIFWALLWTMIQTFIDSCGADLVGGPWSNISATDRGQWRPIYEIAYAYFAQVEGLDMPYTKQVFEANPIEANDATNNLGDSASYGTLRFSRGTV